MTAVILSAPPLRAKDLEGAGKALAANGQATHVGPTITITILRFAQNDRPACRQRRYPLCCVGLLFQSLDLPGVIGIVDHHHSDQFLKRDLAALLRMEGAFREVGGL